MKPERGYHDILELRARIEGAGWIGLDEETRELLKQQANQPVRRVKYDPDQLGCPKVLV